VNPKTVTLLINGGRLLLILGAVIAIYTTYIQQAKLPLIAVIQSAAAPPKDEEIRSRYSWGFCERELSYRY
jgi:hypothetical protein